MDTRDSEYRERVRAQFKTTSGGFDLFVPFMERGIQLLRRSGLFTYIVPNKVLSAEYRRAGAVIRDTLKCGEGADWPLLIVVRGPHAREVRFKPVRSVPDGLVVEMESSQYVADTGLGLTRVRIRIPPGSEPSTHLGDDRGELGEIAIQADPPVLPDVNIRVRFAVAE